MTVKKIKHMAPVGTYIYYITRNILIGLVFLFIALMIGMIGYHTLENMPWLDAFLNSSMILSGMGPVSPLATNAGKIFAGTYALFSGLAFLAIMALIFAPILHRFVHKIHLEINDYE